MLYNREELCLSSQSLRPFWALKSHPRGYSASTDSWLGMGSLLWPQFIIDSLIDFCESEESTVVSNLYSNSNETESPKVICVPLCV